MPIDTGSYGWKFVKTDLGLAPVGCAYPGFVKKYLRRCRRIEKTEARRKQRREGKQACRLD
jgi:hypothetical protein